MTSSPNPSGVPPTPSAVTPGLVVVAGLAACWLTEDPLVLRTAGTVGAVAALIAVIQLTRHVTALNGSLSAEFRSQNREIVRLRDAVNELHEQLGDQQEGVERVRRDALRVRDEAAQVREEAAALLEAADNKVTALGGGPMGSAFTADDPYPEPLTGPRQAFAHPPAAHPPAVEREAPRTFADDRPPAHAPFASQSGFPLEPAEPAQDAAPTPGRPPAPSRASSSDSDEELGYLEDFSISGPDDEPLTQPWSSAESDWSTRN